MSKRRKPTDAIKERRAEEEARWEALSAAMGTRLSAGEQRALFRKCLNNREVPAEEVEKQRVKWMETRNPYYIWQVIEACIWNGFHFPIWVDDYLSDVATRMMAPDATREPPSKALPRIFGFEIKQGARLLAPDLTPDEALSRQTLVLLFAFGIERWGELKRALKCVRLSSDESIVPSDDRTLLKWLKQTLGITHTPRTRAEWLKGIDAWRAVRAFEKWRRDKQPGIFG
jgi:hypothetical protein